MAKDIILDKTEREITPHACCTPACCLRDRVDKPAPDIVLTPNYIQILEGEKLQRGDEYLKDGFWIVTGLEGHLAGPRYPYRRRIWKYNFLRSSYN